MSRTRKPPAAGTRAVGDWILTPEGAAVHPGERTAVIADVHLGYEWARGAAGDCVPAHSLEETLARLDAVFRRVRIARLVVAGDLVESARPCRRTAADVRRLHDWLASRGVDLLALEGNHDRGRIRIDRTSTADASSSSPLAHGGSRLPASCTLDGWTIAHGHRPIAAERTVSGHFHPVLRCRGDRRAVLPRRDRPDRAAGVLGQRRRLRRPERPRAPRVARRLAPLHRQHRVRPARLRPPARHPPRQGPRMLVARPSRPWGKTTGKMPVPPEITGKMPVPREPSACVLAARGHGAVIIRQAGIAVPGVIVGQDPVDAAVVGVGAEDLPGPLEPLVGVAVLEHPPGDHQARGQILGVLDDVEAELDDLVVLLAELGRPRGLGARALAWSPTKVRACE